MKIILSLLVDTNSSPAQLLAAMNEAFGEGWLKWEPATIRAELVDIGFDFDTLPVGSWDKLMATKAAFMNNAPWKDWTAFLTFAQAMNNYRVDFNVARICSPAEAAWTVECLKLIRPDERFSREVQAMIGSIFLSNGIVIPPEGLDFVKDEMKEMQDKTMAMGEFAKIAEERYILHRDQSSVPEGDSAIDIHTIKLLAIDEYIRSKNG